MCGGGGFESLDVVVGRLLKGLAVEPGEESDTTANAHATGFNLSGRAHHDAPREGVVARIKRPRSAKPPGKFPEENGPRVTTWTTGERRHAIARRAKL